MRLKLDENLTAQLAVELRALGHDVDTVIDEHLQGHADPDVWAGAQGAQRFLITQDLDFSDLRRFQPGAHFGLQLVRLVAPGRNALIARVRGLFASEPVETWRRAFVVATDNKLRVRMPEQP